MLAPVLTHRRCVLLCSDSIALLPSHLHLLFRPPSSSLLISLPRVCIMDGVTQLQNYLSSITSFMTFSLQHAWQGAGAVSVEQMQQAVREEHQAHALKSAGADGAAGSTAAAAAAASTAASSADA